MSMKPSNKIVISCAVTGAIHTPSMSPYLPITPEEITDAAVEAAAAGAAIVHLHARDPVNGRPDQRPAAFAAFLPAIKAKSDVILNLTTGGSPYMTVDERMLPAKVFSPEIASMNMGTMNFGLFPMLRRFKEFRYDWEKPYLEGSRDLIFRNTYGDIEAVLQQLSAGGTRFEFECYDTSHLYNLAYFADRKLVEPPFFVQTVFGIMGGIGAHADDVAHMRRTAERLFGDQYVWSVLGAGRNQMGVAAAAASAGGNVRVGLEDSLWIAKSELASSNAQQVRQVRQIVEGMDLEIASPDEARTLLGLKGRNAVSF